MGLQLTDKLMAEKCVIILSFIEQIQNSLKTAITVTLNVDDLFDVFVQKTVISSMNQIFDGGGEGGGLLRELL